MTQPVEHEPRAWQVALVDDDASVLRALSRILTVSGYAVSAFSSGSTFLESLDVAPPEILVIDLWLPGLNGLAIQEAIHDRALRIPIVFLTGWADVTSSMEAIQGGAIDFLEKPCDVRTLHASLERATTAVRREREEASPVSALALVDASPAAAAARPD